MVSRSVQGPAARSGGTIRLDRGRPQSRCRQYRQRPPERQGRSIGLDLCNDRTRSRRA